MFILGKFLIPHSLIRKKLEIKITSTMKNDNTRI